MSRSRMVYPQLGHTSLKEEMCSDSSSSHVGGLSVGVIEPTTWLSFVKLPRSYANMHKSLSSVTK